jgi:YidC/Oxa1 family membrane protein insertase
MGADLSATQTATPISESIPPGFSNIDTLTIDTPDLGNLPEQLGYLHSLGIDYGWGPTSILQWTIEHFHIWGGLPWWGSIAATSVLLRLVLLPLYLRSSDAMARQTALMSVTKPITDRMTAARKNKDTPAVAAAYQELKAVRRAAGISVPKQFAPMLLQGVFGYCGFKLLRACAKLPVPAFKWDGFLWLKDLTVPDPYLILPLAMAGVVHMLVRVGGETGAAAQNQMMPQMYTFMLWGMPVIVMLGTGWVPGAVAVWFAAGGALGVVQSLLLRQPRVREFLGIAQIYKPPAGQEAESPMKTLLDGWTRKKQDAIDVKGKVKEENRSGGVAASGRAATAGMGKNEVFMRPTYQKPNLRFTSPARASSSSPQEVAASEDDSSSESISQPPKTSSSDEMIPPSGKVSEPTPPGGAGGVLDRASEAWKQTRQQASNKVKGYIEKQSENAGYSGEGKRDVDKMMRKREQEVFKRRNEEYEKRKNERAKKAEEGTKAVKGKKGGKGGR